MSIILTQSATRVRGGAAPYYADGQEASMALTKQGAVITAPGMSPYVETVRLGNMWCKSTDAVACVTAIPTVAGAHVIWNGNLVTGKSVVIDALSWACTTSNGAATAFTMVGMLDNTLVATQAATADSATAVASLSGLTYAGGVKSSHTVTVVNKGWFTLTPHGHSGALTATVGCSLYVPINGMIIIPPGSSLAISVVAQSTTALGILSVFFQELKLDLQNP